MSMAMKYAMSKKKASKDGAPCDEHGVHMCKMCHGGECYADGGDVKGVNTGKAGDNVLLAKMHKEDKHDRYAGAYAKAHKDLAKKEHHKVLKEMKSMGGKDRKYLADGGEVEDNKPKSAFDSAAQSIKHAFLGEEKAMGEEAPEKMPEDKNPVSAGMKKAFKAPGYYGGGSIDKEVYDEDLSKEISDEEIDHAEGEDELADKIMKHRMRQRRGYSEGGRVANEAGPIVDSMPAEYDDLVKDDHLEFHETGANSGDELGDAQEDKDRHDIVSMIMASRKKKDRLPRPA